MQILEMSAAAAVAPCKLNVILDIDETFVYFIKNAHFAHSWDTLSPGEKAKYEVHRTDNTGHAIIVRPHLETLLDYLFANCTVSLWTWSDLEYAKDIANRFVTRGRKDRKIEYIFSEKDAGASADGNENIPHYKFHGNSKDLNYLWYGKMLPCFSECNTILIDDLPNNSGNPSNRKNSITIKPFALFGEVKDRSDEYEDVSEDRTLLEVIEILEKVKHLAVKNYTDEDKRYTNIFSPENVSAAGLEESLIEYNFKGETVRGIGAGFRREARGGAGAGGGRRRRRKTRRRVRRRRSTRKRARHV
jgi:hypothetical protein